LSHFQGLPCNLTDGFSRAKEVAGFGFDAVDLPMPSGLAASFQFTEMGAVSDEV